MKLGVLMEHFCILGEDRYSCTSVFRHFLDVFQCYTIHYLGPVFGSRGTYVSDTRFDEDVTPGDPSLQTELSFFLKSLLISIHLCFVRQMSSFFEGTYLT